MDNKKIEIQIKDNGIKTYIALIIDRPGVRDELHKLHLKWGDKELKNRLIGFNLDIQVLFDKYKLPITLYPTIKEAILTGKITQAKRVMRIIIPRETLFELIDKDLDNIADDNYEYGLWTAMEATETEVASEFKELKQTVGSANLNKIKVDNYLRPPISDTFGNIDRDRTRYWQHLPVKDGGQGLTYKQIAFIEARQLYEVALPDDELSDDLKLKIDNHAMSQVDSIRKSIKHYEKRFNRFR